MSNFGDKVYHPLHGECVVVREVSESLYFISSRDNEIFLVNSEDLKPVGIQGE